MFQISKEWLPTQLCQTKQKVSDLQLGVCLQVNVKILVLLIKLRSIVYINLRLYSNKGGWLIEKFECFAKFWIPFRRLFGLATECVPVHCFRITHWVYILFYNNNNNNSNNNKLLLFIIIKLNFLNWSLQKNIYIFNWLYIKF